MPKIPQPGPAASIVVHTNNRGEGSPLGPVYPFAAIRQAPISKHPHFRQTDLMLMPDSPSGLFRPACSQGVLSEQSYLHGRPQWLKFQCHGSP
jgi:hypothetical protein